MASTPWDKALVKFQAGDFDEAVAILERAVAQAEKARGADHPDFAQACAHLAELQTALGDQDAAITAMRRAVAAHLPGPPGQRDHVGYLLQLGELLRESGEIDEAEEVQREGLAAREALFGAGQPGHAVGQVALAEVLIDQNALPEAAGLLEAALQALWKLGHPAVARALALRALCIKAIEGEKTECFQPLGALPAELFLDTVQQAITLVDRGHPGPTLALLQELEGRVSERQPGALRDLYGAIAEAAELSGEGLAAVAALLELEALAPHPSDRVEVLIRLAQIQAEVQPAQAETTWARALAAAELLLHPELLVTTRRCAGEWLAEQGRAAEAEPLLRGAVELARAEDLYEALARSLISLGIFLRDDPSAARVLLEEGIARLPPGDDQLEDAQAALDAVRPQDEDDEDDEDEADEDAADEDTADEGQTP